MLSGKLNAVVNEKSPTALLTVTVNSENIPGLMVSRYIMLSLASFGQTYTALR